MSSLNSSLAPRRFPARTHASRADGARRLAVFLSALCVFAASASLFLYVRGRAAGATFYSRGSLPPQLLASWNTARNGTGTPPSSFTSGDTFVIQNTHNMSTTSAWSISGTNSKLQIESGGTLTANNAVTLASAATFQIDGGGTYVHNNSSAYGSTIFQGTESFAPTSTVVLNNSNTTGPANVAFGNLTVNFTTDPGDVNCAGKLNTIGGSFTIVNTQAHQFSLSGNTAYALTIGNHLIVQGGTLNLTNGSNTGNVFAINIGGSFNQTGGTFTSTNTGSFPTVAFNGGSSFVTFTQSAGTLTGTNINWQIANGKTVQFNNAFNVAASRAFNINSGGLLLASATIANNGTMTVNGEFRLTDGGFATGTDFVYDANATLGFIPSGSYAVNAGHAYWPTTNGPQNVNVLTGVVALNTARTVGGLFQTAAGVTINSPLTLNGTCRINAGGFFSGSPTYGDSSLLKYNIGNPSPAYGRNGEWLPGATSGAGYPANVQLSNNTTLDLANGSVDSPFQMSGDLTIDSGSALDMAGSTPLKQPLTVRGSVQISGTLNLSTEPGGDLHTQGNWSDAGTFTPNGRAVFFEGGAAAQTVGKSGGETFACLFVNKSSGSVQLLSAASVNAASGDVLQLSGGALDLNGQTLSLNGVGGNIHVVGSTRTIGASNASNFSINGAKTVTSSGGGALSFGSHVNVNLGAGVDFGAGLSTVGGTLSIKSGGFVNTNAPAYAPGSTLEYDNGASYDAAAEFPASGVQNVSLASTIKLNLNGDKSIAGTFAAAARTVGTNAATPYSLSANSITVSNGTINLNSVTTSNAFSANGAASINVAGDWNVAGFSAGASTVNFDGAGAQVILTASAFNNLTASNDLSLSAGPTVNGTLALGAHKITTHADTLGIGGAGLVTRTTGYIVGSEQKSFTGPGSFTFDVGTANGYSPVDANSTSGAGSLTVAPAQTRQPNIKGANALQRFWTLSGSGITANLTFHYLAGDVVGTESVYQIIRHDPSGFTVPSGQSVDTGAHTATAGGVKSFSDWTLAEPASVFGQIQFAQANTDTAEGHTGTHTVDLFVRRLSGTSGAVSVDYAVTDGTATTADNDYSVSPATGTLNWPDGDSADKTITINVNGDTAFEPDETVNLSLSNAQGGALLGSPTATTLTIRNDDNPPPSITINGGPLNFGSIAVGGFSAEQTYTVSGSNLTADLNVAAPADFQVSKTTGAGFGPSLTLTQSGGMVAATTIFVRFAPTTQGVESGNVFNASDGATTRNVAVSGTGVSPDYTVTTTGGAIVVTDVSGNGDTLAVLEPSAGNIKFAAAARTFSIDGSAVVAGDSGDLSLNGVSSITVNAAAGGDTINVGAFSASLPSLTLDGGTGDDTVNFDGSITFAADANLDVDLQNDDPTPGTDALAFAPGARVTLSGKGAATFKVSRSISFGSASKLQVENGNLSIEADQQASPTAGDFKGITLDAATINASGTGNISLKGKGGTDATTNSHFGIHVNNGSTINSTSNASGAGTVALDGTAGQGTNQNRGVQVEGAGTTITSLAGDISINGHGGSGSGPGNNGIDVDSGATLVASGPASISLTGTGGSGSSDCYGVGLDGGGQPGTTVSAVNGDISINGVAGGATGTNQDGVRFENSRGTQAVSVNTTGKGALTVNGTAGDDDPTSAGIHIVDDTTMTLSGAINTFIADTLDFHNSNVSVNAGPNALTLRQKTDARVIDLGGADSPTQLGLEDAELDLFTCGTLNVGDSRSGAINVSAGVTRPASTNVNLSSGGAINLDAGSLDTGGGSVTLTPGAGASVTPAAAGTDVSMGATGTLAFPSGANLSVAINGTNADTQYQQLNVVGQVSLDGVNLALSGTLTSVAGRSFVVVNNDGADAIKGTFNGLPEGATISNFLNSGFDATISYTGGDGNDAVVTVNSPPAFSIDDVKHAEGNTGTTAFTFNVTKAGSTAVNASVDFATQDATATTADVDYQSASGTLNFAAGETLKTITVHVNGDTTPELDETFRVVLGNASGATINRGTGTGTIANDDESAGAGQLIISEFRLRGPGTTGTSVAPAKGGSAAAGGPATNSSTKSKPRASVSFAPPSVSFTSPSDVFDTSPQANDEFVELYNNTDTPLLVTTTDGSKGWALAASDGVVRFVIPNGTLIPARGHFLGVNTLGYSLSGYPAGNDGAATTNATGDPILLGDGTPADGYTLDIPDNMGIAVFRTANPSNFAGAGARLDAAGATSEANALYKEGGGYPALAPSDIAQNLEHSFYRSLCSYQSGVGCTTPGVPKDTNDNAADFFFVDTGGTLTAAGQRLGAPGPENLSSHVQRNSQVAIAPLDRSVPASEPPNRSRDFTPDPGHNSPLGTLSIRRRVTNNTGTPFVQLRFRIVEITTSPAGSGVADLRALSSAQVSVSNVSDPDTCGGPMPCTVNAQGTTLEEPPTQLSSTGGNGGGYNSSLSVGTVTLSAPLAPGDSVNVQFLLGIKQTGIFRILLNVEAVAGASKK
ncbi:MAG TPA: Calx-beta domain-containing protein [Pyrinomonadaceae bacterium]|jgi:hypothetical protein|nr:Calx-beta domain-containing protein [Pyrinomonadaceae bacterium]